MIKTFEITYLSYEGKTRRMDIEAENEEDAECKAVKEDIGCGDGIYKIIDCTEK